MKVVSIVSQKGGAGKTTVSVNLATAAARAGHSVAILDIDLQSSAAQWGDWRADESPTVVAVPYTRLEPALKTAQEGGADLVVIDTGPAADGAANAAAKAADLIIVPTRAAAFDLHAIKTTADLLQRWGKPTYALLNAVPSFAGNALEQAAEVVLSHGLNLAPVALGERVAYRHAVIAGKSAGEYDPNSKAATEVNELYEWVCDRIGLVARPLARRFRRKD